MSELATTSVRWHEETGHFLSKEHQRIAQVIHDYDPTLELAWIPPENRTLQDTHPFAIIHHPVGQPSYVVMRLKENEVDHRVIGRLWRNDVQNGNVLDAIEKDEAARNAVEYLRREEEMEEAREMAAWMVKAPAGSWMRNPNDTGKIRLT